jgi:hypothetical protein
MRTKRAPVDVRRVLRTIRDHGKLDETSLPVLEALMVCIDRNLVDVLDAGKYRLTSAGLREAGPWLVLLKGGRREGP